MAQWWYSAAGQPAGPINDQQLLTMAATGQLSPTSAVYRDDLADWYTLEAFEGLLGLQRNSWGGYYVPTVGEPLQGSDPTEPASAWQRFAAYWIDGLVIRTICWVFAFLFAPSIINGSVAGLILLFVVVSAVPLVYETLLHAVRGQTVGKRRMNIEVVGCEYSELLSFPRSLARSLINLVTWPVNVFVVLLTPDHRGLHDRAVNSRVQRFLG